MVVEELFHALPIPDPRPTKANPEERAKRKQHEKEHPHFQMQEFGLKAGVLALMATVALYPWEKKYDDHVAKHHPERLEKGDGKGRDKERSRKGKEDERERRRSADGEGRRNGGVGYEYGRGDGGRRERRRMTIVEGNGGGRKKGYIDDRRGSVPPSSDVGSQRVGANAGDPRAARRRSMDPVALRLAVADGYSYIPQDKGYIDGRRSAAADWDRGPREFVQDQYVFRPRRTSGERRVR